MSKKPASHLLHKKSDFTKEDYLVENQQIVGHKSWAVKSPKASKKPKEIAKENAADTSNETIKANSKKRSIPKNIRQMGELDKASKKKIYMEDYVVTYLNQLAHPVNSKERGALLLGEWVHYDKEDVLYISGAMELANITVQHQTISLEKENWTQLCDTINHYFGDLSVIGWFVSRLGCSVELNPSMLDLHKEHFKGENTVLYLMDSLEQEDAFYLYQQGKLARQSGFMIYYERNTMMQNYLIENHVENPNIITEKEIDYKDGALLHNYHEVLAGRKTSKEERRVANLLFAVSSILLLIVFGLGISIFNNYDRMQNLQASIRELAETDEDVMTTNASVADEAETATANSTDAITGEQVATELSNVAMLSRDQSSGNDAVDDTGQISKSDQDENASIEDREDADETPPKPDSSATKTASNAANTTSVTLATANEIASDAADDTVSNQNTADNESTTNSNDTTAETSGTAKGANSSSVGSSNESAAASMSNMTYYTVQAGDTLLLISQRMYQSNNYVQTLKDANQIDDSDTIYVGQKLVIPMVQ